MRHMKIVIFVATLSLWATPAITASFDLRFLMPTVGDSTCAGTIRPLENAKLKGHWRWWVAGGDSIAGAVEDSTGVVPPGLQITTPRYSGIPSNSLLRARAWASDSLQVMGCDTTITFRPFTIRPWRLHRL